MFYQLEVVNMDLNRINQSVLLFYAGPIEPE
jgi:hypothetical protein